MLGNPEGLLRVAFPETIVGESLGDLVGASVGTPPVLLEGLSDGEILVE